MTTYSVGTYGGGSSTVLPPVFGVGQESLNLDGLELNNGNPWTILREPAFEFRQAPKKLNFADSPLADGAALVGDDDHYQNAEMVFAVTASTQVSTDAALAAFHALTQKLQEARRTPGEMPLVWTKAGSSDSLTFYLHDAEYEEIDASRSGGWFSNTVSLTIHLYLRPFGYGAEQQADLGYTEPFTWDSISGGRWRFDTGSGSFGVSSGALVPSTEVVKELYLPWTATNATVAIRFKVGSTTSGNVGVTFRRKDSTHFLIARKLADAVVITRVNATPSPGSFTTLATTSYTFAASTFYWLVANVVGDDISATIYPGSQNPFTTSPLTPLADVSHTLTGADSTEFTDGVRGNVGIFSDPPSSSPGEWIITDFLVRGMPDIQSAEPLMHFEVADVKGHVPAEARLVVTEAGNASKAHFEYGEETRNYVQGSPLILDSEVLTLAGSTRTATTGNYNPTGAGTNTVHSQPLAKDSAIKVATTNIQGHVGSYKVKARVKGTEGIRLRLAWQAGDTEFVHNPYTPGCSGVYQEVDLGTIVVDQAVLGVHYWLGKIEAYSPITAGGRLDIDYLLLIPQERYGVARAPLVPVVGDSYALLDNWLQISGGLSGKTLEVPAQNWSTAAHSSPVGPSGDYAVVDSLDAVERTTLKDGWATTGNTTNGSVTITNISSGDVTRMRDANTVSDPDTIYGSGIPGGAFVQSKPSPTSITISGTGATATATGVALTIGNPNYGRFALAGTTNTYSAIQLQVTLEGRQTSAGLNNIPVDGKIRLGLLARYSSPDNWVACVRENYAVAAIEYSKLRVYKRLAGVTTMLGSKPEPGTRLGDRRTIIFTLDTAGVWQAYSFAAGSLPPASPLISGQDDQLASGPLVQGQVGLFDVMANPYVDNLTRRYFNFSGFTASSGVVMNALQGMEIRSDTAERANSGGTSWGKVPMFRGERFLIPSEGDNQYVTRIAAKARRLNVDEGLADPSTSPSTFALDPITVSVRVSPRYLHLAGQNQGG